MPRTDRFNLIGFGLVAAVVLVITVVFVPRVLSKWYWQQWYYSREVVSCPIETNTPGRRASDRCQDVMPGTFLVAKGGELAFGRAVMLIGDWEWRPHVYLVVPEGKEALIDYGAINPGDPEFNRYTQEGGYRDPRYGIMVEWNKRNPEIFYQTYSQELR